MLMASLDDVDVNAQWRESIMPDTGGAVIRYGYMLAAPEGAPPSPQAIFVDQPPNSTIPMHFHDNAQFQVVVAGSAKFGNHDVKPIAVHYAAHQTVYGPIIAGKDGLVYLTLRPFTEEGAHWWPGERPDSKRASARLQLTEQGGEAALSELRKLSQAATELVIPPDDTGLASWIMRVPPGQSAQAPTHVGGGGQFLVVTAGSMVFRDRSHKRMALVWLGPDEQLGQARAGGDGLELVITQFPQVALNS
jgi:hypothetical protein